MIYKVLHIGFNTYDKNLFLIIYYQACKYKIAMLFKVIGAINFNIFFIYLKKCYIQYNINSNQSITR